MGPQEKILRAAETLFAARGFAGVSVRDIAEEAGVTKGLLFYYFDNKSKLFANVIEKYYKAHSDALSIDLEADGDYRARLHQLVDAYVDFVEDNWAYVQIVQREMVEGSEALPLIRQGVRLLYERVAEVMNNLVPDDASLHPRHFYVTLSGLVNNYFMQALVLDEIWDNDPLGTGARRQRREHVHWIVNRVLDGLSSSSGEA